MSSFALTNFQKVRYFNIVFGSPRSEVPTSLENNPSLTKLRWDLINEESTELFEALDQKDYVEIIDAISDILYVVLGASDSFGTNLDPFLEYSDIETLILKWELDLQPELDGYFSLDRMKVVLENDDLKSLTNQIKNAYQTELDCFLDLLNTPQSNQYDLVIKQLVVLHNYLYLWAYLFGFNLNQAFNLVHDSNMSKLATTEEIAKETVEWYLENNKTYDSPAYRLSTVQEAGQDRWVIFNQSSGKALKSVKYHPVDLKTFLDSGSNVCGKFDSESVQVILARAPGFDSLTETQKEYLYHSSEACLNGYDIIYDQQSKINLSLKIVLVELYILHRHQPEFVLNNLEEWEYFVDYLHTFWISNGIYHYQTEEKIPVKFSQDFFDLLQKNLYNCFECTYPAEIRLLLERYLFTPYHNSINGQGDDLILTNRSNLRSGVSEKEAQAYYLKKETESKEIEPSLLVGLNSRLTKTSNGTLTEEVYGVNRYEKSIREITKELELAADHARGHQKAYLGHLVKHFRTGGLKSFNDATLEWIKSESSVDTAIGFIENYLDPLQRVGSYQGATYYMNNEATKRTRLLGENAQWFEDHAPINPKHRNPDAKTVNAVVVEQITSAGLIDPIPFIGQCLPNHEKIRTDFGSKTVTVQNFINAYDIAGKSSGKKGRFMLKHINQKLDKYLPHAYSVAVDLHEALGHASGKIEDGLGLSEDKVRTDLGEVFSPLEEARADLFAMYYISDPKLIELGILHCPEEAEAYYDSQLTSGMMSQLGVMPLGKTELLEAHQINRMLISRWLYENQGDENQGDDQYIKKIIDERGYTFFEIMDYQKMRTKSGELLEIVQTIKSTGDYKRGKELIDAYGRKIDQELHKEVHERIKDVKTKRSAIQPPRLLKDSQGKVRKINIWDYTEFCLLKEEHYAHEKVAC